MLWGVQSAPTGVTKTDTRAAAAQSRATTASR